MKVVDFFCGSGGFSEGFRQAGFDIILAVDKWEPAVNTYRANKPNTTVIKEDVITIADLPDEEFHALIPDSEIIIGSPPCQAFSNSNKSGNGDKTLGIQLLEAYLKIIVRKKEKKGSILKHWILENVPNTQKFVKDSYSYESLKLPFPGELKIPNRGIYNAKYFGAPSNRIRFLCGEFRAPAPTHNDDNLVTLGQVLDSLSEEHDNIVDINNPGFIMAREEVTDLDYEYAVEEFEWKKAERLKRDKGFMGKMSFPENENKPSRTVMATMSASSRESMILRSRNNNQRYRLPTVREAASMMSFPIDYQFYGKSKGIKYTLVGNAVCPKLSYALARAIKEYHNMQLPGDYIPIIHNKTVEFINLNGLIFPKKTEKTKRNSAKFKYHIPYFIYNQYRVELTNNYSDFESGIIKWIPEIHYSQGKDKAKVYTVESKIMQELIMKYSISGIDFELFSNEITNRIGDKDRLQLNFRLTDIDRGNLIGPFELLDEVKIFLERELNINPELNGISVKIHNVSIPLSILMGYYVLQLIVEKLG